MAPTPTKNKNRENRSNKIVLGKAKIKKKLKIKFIYIYKSDMPKISNVLNWRKGAKCRKKVSVWAFYSLFRTRFDRYLKCKCCLLLGGLSFVFQQCIYSKASGGNKGRLSHTARKWWNPRMGGKTKKNKKYIKKWRTGSVNRQFARKIWLLVIWELLQGRTMTTQGAYSIFFSYTFLFFSTSRIWLNLRQVSYE